MNTPSVIDEPEPPLTWVERTAAAIPSVCILIAITAPNHGHDHRPRRNQDGKGRRGASLPIQLPDVPFRVADGIPVQGAVDRKLRDWCGDEGFLYRPLAIDDRFLFLS